MTTLPIEISKQIIEASGGILTGERDRLQACADQHLADNRESLAVHLQECELWPEDSELLASIRHMFMREWGMDSEQADARMAGFDYAKAMGV